MTDLRWLEQEPDDTTYAAVHALVSAVAATHGAVGWLEVPERTAVDGWLREVLASGARLVLAYDGDRLVGCGYWARQSAAVLARNAEVRKVMTAPDMRGRGVARAVTAALVADARAAGVEVMTMDCRGNNHAALGLYASLGFVVTGRRPDFIAVGEHRFDQVLLHLDLRATEPAVQTPPLVRHGGRREGLGST